MMWMIRLITHLSCAIALCGESCFVPSLTDLMGFPPTLSLNDKSRIHLKLRDLCGMSATGDILRLFG